MKVAFLIIDMQIECVDHEHIMPCAIQASEYINEVSGYFRKYGYPVVIVQDLELEGGAENPKFEFIPQINIEESDIRVHKEYSNSFWKTDLEQILRDQGVELVVIAGFAAEYCALFTYNGALERGFKTVFLQNGVVGNHPDSVTKINRDYQVASYSVINMLLKK
ncbi:isochorismatase family protein [Paenibacillus sp. N1-5-1-14]|uniref:cysteine hydrolase family protein n=1 Tax=Paenibacillus radicibacter TaxID=2972488 RepID=UPI002158A409|nr:isochorismatase family protein [Paenibacillus radicibacter]MCR8641071.1 isochorismatase family protein [Paenibacillus radicibacter]